MSLLKYKTRGHISPQGKPRVFFCCHPDDFNSCFETISNEILAMQNCSIWYIDEAVDRGEDFLEDLKQMQLFIMPVTTKLLCTGNSAIDVEFPFAVENHIPVLPLMQEGGLEDLFNKKCGDLQFLDKHNVDITAINYDEKLKKYLESVLVGDELAEKIRAAFDAYVFLSYRKKDRKYAQELMRLIHKNDFCRDIAIWYDEFLTPGEDFNDSIKEALQKSGLFVLTVTPNLVNEPNYIMTTEYPMARQQDKPILPAELLPTDRKRLSEKYVGIPKPTDAHNETELSKALLESIKKIAIKENDASPEHNFFIGLAYLSGIDVEVNHDRALLLITSAAESGLVEAMTKIVAMYNNGIGVAQNYIVAISWMERVISFWKQQYFEKKESYAFEKLCYALIECGAAYKNIGNLISAEEKYLKVIKCIQAGGATDPNSSLAPLLSCVYNDIGLVYSDKGDFVKAREYYEKDINLTKMIWESKGNSTTKASGLWAPYHNLGNLCTEQGDSQAAMEYYKNALQACEGGNDNISRKRENMAMTYHALGGVSMDLLNVTEAKQYYKKALAIRLEIEIEFNSSEAKCDAANTYSQLGDISLREGDNDSAEKYYLLAHKLFSEALQRSNSLSVKNDYALCLLRFGRLYGKCGTEKEIKRATDYFEKAIDLLESISEISNQAKVKWELGVCNEEIADMYLEANSISISIDHYEKALTLYEEIAEIRDSIRYLRARIGSFRKLAKAHRSNGNYEEALGCFKKCEALLTRLIEKHATLTDMQECAILYCNIGQHLQGNGELDEALTYYKKQLTLCEKIGKKSDMSRSKRDIAASLGMIGSIYLEKSDVQKARNYLLQYYELSLEISQTLDNEQVRQDLATATEQLGLTYERENNYSLAKTYYKLAVEHREKLVELDPSSTAKKALAFIYARMGVVEQDTTIAEQWYHMAKDLGLEVYDKTECPNTKRLLAVINKNIAKFSEGDFEKAQSYYIQAIELYSELVYMNNQYTDKIQLIKTCCRLGKLLNSEKAKTSLALQYYEKAHTIIEEIGIVSFPIEDLGLVEDYYSGVGAVYHLKGEYNKARENYVNAISIVQTMNKSGTENQYKLAYEHAKVAETYYMDSNREDSIRYYSEAVCICKSIQGYENIDKVVGLLSACYDWLGIIYKLKQNIDEAEKYCNMSHEMNQRLVVSNPSYNNRRNIALYNFKIGEIAELRGDIIKATKDYKKCVHLCVELSREFSYRQCYADLAIAYHQLANVEDKTENLKKAYSIISQLSEQFPDVSLYAEFTRYYKKDLELCNG